MLQNYKKATRKYCFKKVADSKITNEEKTPKLNIAKKDALLEKESE
jgi:hypothetical protein